MYEGLGRLHGSLSSSNDDDDDDDDDELSISKDNVRESYRKASEETKNSGQEGV